MRLALAACAAAALTGCPGDDTVCGPPAAVGDGIELAGDGREFLFTGFVAAHGGDCPAPSTPADVVSVTVVGNQTAPAGTAVITLCLPRPDLLSGDAGGVTVPLDPDNQPAEADDRTHVIDVQADLGDGCRWRLDPAVDPDGTARYDGACQNTDHPDGFGLTVEGDVTLTETCPGVDPRTIEATLGGSVLVVPG